MSPEAVAVARRALEGARVTAELMQRDAQDQHNRAQVLERRADAVLADAIRERDAALEALQWFDAEFPEGEEEDGFVVPTDDTDPQDPAWTEVQA